MARVDLPESKLKQRRRRRRIRLVILAFFVACVALSGAVALAHVRAIRISTIITEGQSAVPAETIREIAQRALAGRYGYLFPRDNIFLYPKTRIERALLAELPTVKTAELSAQNFTTLGIQVLERTPRARWCPSTGSGQADGGDGCYLADEDGVVYAPATTTGFLAYYGPAEGERLPRQYLHTEEFHSLTALVDALAQKEGVSAVESVSVDENGRDVRVRFAGGFMLLFSLADDGGDIFERFSLALTAEPFLNRPLSAFEYLDLRFGDKLYYKSK